LNALNRRIMRFPAPYGAAPEQILQQVERIARSIPQVSAESPPQVRIAEFADSSITYEILYWIRDYMWAHSIEATMRERIWYAFKRSGIDIPFPTRHMILQKPASAERSAAQDFADFLAGVEMLKPLGPEEVKTVAGAVAQRIYAPGEFVMRTGEAADSMFVIHRGRAEVLAPDAGGDYRQVAVLEPGNVIGEMGLFTGESRRADVRAQDELELLEIGKPVMRTLLTDNASLAEAFSRIISQRQAELVRHAETPALSDHFLRPETVLDRIKRFFTLSRNG
jgi:CRP-like cAMP-binding protein